MRRTAHIAMVPVMLLAVAANAQSAEWNRRILETPNYVVDITIRCEEGVMGCDDVIYHGRSKRSGRSITLRGQELYRPCADGITPCRFLGYRFRGRGGVIYDVLEDGTLRVYKGQRTLLEEQGSWKD